MPPSAEVPHLTRMMVTVRDAVEAAKAAVIGVDGIEWAMTATSEAAEARTIRAAFSGRFRLRLQAWSPGAAKAARADEIAVSVETASPDIGTTVDGDDPILIAVIDSTGDAIDTVTRLRGRVGGIMLDASPRRLIGDGGVARLDAFAAACRRAGLPFGFAGGLEVPDVARLLLLEPDVLGFGTAGRSHQEPGGSLNLAALETIRALIPKVAVAGDGGDVPLGSIQAGPIVPDASDLLFVRDFVTTLSIGAYRQEHGRRQRVRFSVEVAVTRAPAPPRDMRDVFSYDVIIETIRVLAERGHVTFVETLAEEIAAALLTHAALTRVTVKVEKLDVIDGAVGIEIRRSREPGHR